MSLGNFKERTLVFAGERYISDLVDVDAAVGTYLVDLLDSLRSSGNYKKYKPFEIYTKKPKKEKLFLSQETEPKVFLTKMRQKFFEGDGTANIKNKNALPVVYFHREPSLTLNQDGRDIVIKDYAEITLDGDSVAKVDAVPLTLTYHVYVVAWDQISLTKLAGGLVSAMATSPRKANYKTAVLSQEIDQAAYISAVQLGQCVDLSAPNAEDRLLVYELSFEATANIFQSRIMHEKEINIVVNEPSVFFSIGDLNG